MRNSGKSHAKLIGFYRKMVVSYTSYRPILLINLGIDKCLFFLLLTLILLIFIIGFLALSACMTMFGQ